MEYRAAAVGGRHASRRTAGARVPAGADRPFGRTVPAFPQAHHAEPA
ncbi:MAG TPA: hypothetical protein VGF17_00190 [Phytomonospora sp.]